MIGGSKKLKTIIDISTVIQFLHGFRPWGFWAKFCERSLCNISPWFKFSGGFRVRQIGQPMKEMEEGDHGHRLPTKGIMVLAKKKK